MRSLSSNKPVKDLLPIALSAGVIEAWSEEASHFVIQKDGFAYFVQPDAALDVLYQWTEEKAAWMVSPGRARDGRQAA